MTEADDKLCRMALEIHQFFRHQGEASYAAAANHMKQFWPPTMRADFLARFEADAAPDDPTLARIAEALMAG